MASPGKPSYNLFWYISPVTILLNLAHLNLEQIQSFLFPLETKVKLLIKNDASFKFHFTNKFFDFCFKVKEILKSLRWLFYQSLFQFHVSQRLSLVHHSLKTNESKHNNIQDPDFLCVFNFFMAYFYYIVSLKTLSIVFWTIYFFLGLLIDF